MSTAKEERAPEEDEQLPELALPLGQWTDGELINSKLAAAKTELEERYRLRADAAAKANARRAKIYRTH